MFRVCSICGRQFYEDYNITDTRTHYICEQCYKRGWRIVEKITSSTKAEPYLNSPNNSKEEKR